MGKIPLNARPISAATSVGSHLAMPLPEDQGNSSMFQIKALHVRKKLMNVLWPGIGSYVPILGLLTEQGIPQRPSNDKGLVTLSHKPP